MPSVIVLNSQQVVKVTPPSTPTVFVNNAPVGSSNFQAALNEHIVSPTPHPAYDVDLQSLALIFENRSI